MKKKNDDIIKSGNDHKKAIEWLEESLQKEQNYAAWNGTSYDLMKLIMQGVFVADTWKGTSYLVPNHLRVSAARIIHGYHQWSIANRSVGAALGHFHVDNDIFEVTEITCKAAGGFPKGTVCVSYSLARPTRRRRSGRDAFLRT